MADIPPQKPVDPRATVALGESTATPKKESRAKEEDDGSEEGGSGESSSKKKKGSGESNFGAWLALVGVLATAYATFEGVVLKQGGNPIARISLNLGETSVASAETGTISK
jgi:hypothetical protein